MQVRIHREFIVRFIEKQVNFVQRVDPTDALPQVKTFLKFL